MTGRLTDDEKLAIHARLLSAPNAADLALFAVRGAFRFDHPPLTAAQRDRLRHLWQVEKRIWAWRAERKARDRNAATALAKTHAYRPEFV